MRYKLVLLNILFFLFTPPLYSQSQTNNYPETEIRVGLGIAYTNFFDTNPKPLVFCNGGHSDCQSVKQSTTPSFALSGQFLFIIKPRHQLGLGYSWHQINVKQELFPLPRSTPFIFKDNINYHSVFVQYRFQTNPEKDIWWINAFGTEAKFYDDNLSDMPLLYRTALSFPLQIFHNQNFALEPFFQTVLSDFWKDQEQALIRPFTIGVMVQYIF